MGKKVLKASRKEESSGRRPVVLTIIFCNNAETVNLVADALTQAQLHCIRLWSHAKQEKALSDFGLEQKRILVTTDGASEGIPWSEHLRCIINYDFPSSLEHYCQRL